MIHSGERFGSDAAKPSLHEIAAMPYPASEKAIREHYDKHWHRYSNDELKPFKVEIEYFVRTKEFWECEVEAADEDEAKKIAQDKFDDADLGHSWDEFDDIGNVTVEAA